MKNTIEIPTILKVGNGTINLIGEELKKAGITQVVLYFGDDLIDLFGGVIMQTLKQSGVDVLQYTEQKSTKIEDVIELAFSLPSRTQAVIGIGGGKVIDVAKYVAFIRQIQLVSVPTSSSSDGFASASSSLIVNGRRTSVPAQLAYAIIVDTQILKTAPIKFIYSGIGDMVSKITAIQDWYYEQEHTENVVNDVAVMVAKKAVNSFIRTPFTKITDELFLKELVDSFAMSGLANEIAGSSAPTSGSEHLISHALDKLLRNPELHGVQVGIATYIMSKVQGHRVERIDKILSDTGFWEYVKTLDLNRSDYERAIDLAPSIKPDRYTYLSEERHRALAKTLLMEDVRLREVFRKEVDGNVV